MLTYTVRPIGDRTPFTGDDFATPSQFKVGWSTAEQLLKREVDQIGGRDVVVELDVAERDIRRDGYLRATYRTASGAARLHVVTDGGPLQFATDAFARPTWVGDGRMQYAWQHNLYAIARGLEALRAVDRYGISRGAQQYRGYLALPPGGTAIGETTGMTHDDAVRVVLEAAGWLTAGAELPPFDSIPIAEAFQTARRRTHPDRLKRDDDWNRVEYAGRTLGLIS